MIEKRDVFDGKSLQHDGTFQYTVILNSLIYDDTLADL